MPETTQITASIHLRVKFTAREVEALRQGASSHYDPVCRHFQPVMILSQYILHDMVPELPLSWHDLDILCKICESPLVPDDVSHSIQRTFAELREYAAIAQQAVEA